MSEEIRALSVDLPDNLPEDDIGYLISVLTGGKTLDRYKAVRSSYNVLGYLLGKFFGTATIESTTKIKKVSKKQIAAALSSLTSTGVAPKAFPMWLIPILLDLAQKWLAQQK